MLQGQDLSDLFARGEGGGMGRGEGGRGGGKWNGGGGRRGAREEEGEGCNR